MPALSFQREFVDALLRGDKQQTTRQQTDRFKVGDTAHIYIEQRRRITDKPLHRTTANGREMILFKIENEKTYPPKDCIDTYYAHFLGKVGIAEVYDIRPCEMSEEELKAWAQADGFKDFHPTYRIYTKGVHEDDGANMWFMRRYGNDWMQRTWTVIRWNGWQARYFEAGEV